MNIFNPFKKQSDAEPNNEPLVPEIVRQKYLITYSGLDVHGTRFAPRTEIINNIEEFLKANPSYTIQMCEKL